MRRSRCGGGGARAGVASAARETDESDLGVSVDGEVARRRERRERGFATVRFWGGGEGYFCEPTR